jgi:hypothetical protein
MRHLQLLDGLPAIAASLRVVSGVLSGEAAAHLHLAAATRSVPGQPPRYCALAPRAIEAILPPDAPDLPGIERDRDRVAEVVAGRIESYAVELRLDDGTVVRGLSREAVLAQLLARGGLAIGLAGSLVRLADTPPVDVDEVRELLKAARAGERFQPLLELLQVA